MEISVSGDVYIAPELTGAVAAGEDLIRLMSGFDFNIVNLECPVVLDEGPRKIYKTGPHLKADASIFGFLRQLNVGVVTLANNHILDYGEKGLRQTLDTCGREGVLTVGAGMSLAEASAPLILEKSGIKVAIVNFCENEWSTASSTAAGANPMDFVDNLGQIRKARGMADFVIAVVHGGHERYNLPSPRMAKTYRFYAENGADAVIGHHTHCVSGFEIHGGVPIAYGLGFGLDNAAFPAPTPTCFHWGGIGGSWALMDPKAQASLGYAPNHLAMGPSSQDIRDARLSDALATLLPTLSR